MILKQLYNPESRTSRPLHWVLAGIMTTGILFCTFPARSEADSNCDKFKEDRQKDCYLKEFHKVDNSLNNVYKQLKNRIQPAVAQLMQKQSRNWIKYKEYQCGWQSQIETGKNNDSATYYKCLSELTRERTTYIKSAFSKRHNPAGLAGSYDDAFGGLLSIHSLAKSDPVVTRLEDPLRGPVKLPAFKEGTKYKFKIEVVRGPTAHIGEIEGEFIIQNGMGLYMEPAVSELSDGKCKLEFTMHVYSIAIREKQCGYYHGARAFFDGTFYRIK